MLMCLFTYTFYRTTVAGVCDGDSLGYEPVGGVSRSGKGIVISDVPGLLEGAHRGLGKWAIAPGFWIWM